MRPFINGTGPLPVRVSMRVSSQRPIDVFKIDRVYVLSAYGSYYAQCPMTKYATAQATIEFSQLPRITPVINNHRTLVTNGLTRRSLRPSSNATQRDWYCENHAVNTVGLLADCVATSAEGEIVGYVVFTDLR